MKNETDTPAETRRPVVANFSLSVQAKENGGLYLVIASHGEKCPEFVKVEGEDTESDIAVLETITVLEGISAIGPLILHRLKTDNFENIEMVDLELEVGKELEKLDADDRN
jgi:hypothetical protein